MKENLTLRMATEDDYAPLHRYSNILGVFQKMSPDKLVITPERMKEMLKDKTLESIIAELDGEIAGVGLFYIMPSGFSGKEVIFLHIFYVEEHLQHEGIGKAIMVYLSKLALERNIERLEWLCLDWNEPAKQFYYDIGAQEIDIVKTFRLSPEGMQKLVDENPL